MEIFKSTYNHRGYEVIDLFRVNGDKSFMINEMRVNFNEIDFIENYLERKHADNTVLDKVIDYYLKNK